MGEEANGLIRFSPCCRGPNILLETTLLNGGAIYALGIRRLLLAMESIFIVVAFWVVLLRRPGLTS
jgi:hypothetical protein